MTTQRTVRAARVRLEILVNEFTTEVQQVASAVLSRSIIVRLSWPDQLRLFNMRMWLQVYQVSLHYVLQVLLEYWKNIRRTQQFKQSQGLGIRVATLVGKRSRSVLLAQIIKDFPTGENRLMLRSALESQVAASEEVMGTSGKFNVRDPRRFIIAYRARIKRARKGIEELHTELELRQWRGNPY
jgi:hypothetical protein